MGMLKVVILPAHDTNEIMGNWEGTPQWHTVYFIPLLWGDPSSDVSVPICRLYMHNHYKYTKSLCLHLHYVTYN